MPRGVALCRGYGIKSRPIGHVPGGFQPSFNIGNGGFKFAPRLADRAISENSRRGLANRAGLGSHC